MKLLDRLLDPHPIYVSRTRTFMASAVLALSISSITAALTVPNATGISPAATGQTSAAAGQSTADQKPEERKEEPFKVGNGVTPPRLISSFDPEFPKSPKNKKVTGTVELSAVIDKDGRAKGIRVVKPLDPEFDQNAVNAVQRWRFEPGQKEGKPVSVEIHITVEFRRL